MILFIIYLQKKLSKITIFLAIFITSENGSCNSTNKNSLNTFLKNQNEIVKLTLNNLVENNIAPIKWHVLHDKNFFFQPTSLKNHNFKDKKIAILIPGLFSGPAFLTYLARFLKNEAVYQHILCLSYGSTNPNFVQNMTESLTLGLSHIICRNKNTQQPTQVDIFAHSFGGLITRNTLDNLNSKDSKTILQKCKHIFFFGTPHNGIKPIIFKNIGEVLYNKALSDPNIGGMIQMFGLSLNTILSAIENLEFYQHLTGKTNLLSDLKPIPKSSRYYNIIGLNPNIEFPDLNLPVGKLSINNFIYEGYKKFDSKSITDGVVPKESASLTPKGLEPSHELAVHYNHNLLIGIGNKENPHQVPKPICEWIKSILKNHFFLDNNLSNTS